MRINGQTVKNLTPTFAPATSISYMFLCIVFIWQGDLDLRPFDLGDVSWIKCTYQFLQLSIPELCVTQSDHITFTWTVTAHAPCHVTYHAIYLFT